MNLWQLIVSLMINRHEVNDRLMVRESCNEKD